MFLGCPSITYKAPHNWDRLDLLLKACTKLSKQEINKAAEDGAVVANVSERFRESSLEPAVISVYEGKPTKFGNDLFVRKKYEVSSKYPKLHRNSLLIPLQLIDLSLASTGVGVETLVRAEANHYDICDLSRSSSHFCEVEAFFSACLRTPSLAESHSSKGGKSRNSKGSGYLTIKHRTQKLWNVGSHFIRIR